MYAVCCMLRISYVHSPTGLEVVHVCIVRAGSIIHWDLALIYTFLVTKIPVRASELDN